MTKSHDKQGHQIFKSILVTILFLIVVSAGGAVSMMTGLDSRITMLIAYLLTAGGLIGYVWRKKRWADYGFPTGRGIHKTNILVYSPLFVMALLPLIVGLSSELKWTDLGYVLGFMAIVAFVEETIFRGIVLKLLQAKGNLVAVLGSSFLFSILHALNALTGKEWGQTLFQIGFALLIGVILAILMIRTHDILPLILYHFVNNTVASISRADFEPSLSLLISAIVFVIGAIYAVSLIVSKKQKSDRA
jgi:membrane protease YdiL (CAAX protease family)